MKVYRHYFQGRTKVTRAACMLKLPDVAQQNCLFLNKGNVFSWLTFLIVLTLKTVCQRQNHLRKYSSKHLSPASHDLRGLDPSSLSKFFRESELFQNRPPGLLSKATKQKPTVSKFTMTNSSLRRTQNTYHSRISSPTRRLGLAGMFVCPILHLSIYRLSFFNLTVFTYPLI